MERYPNTNIHRLINYSIPDICDPLVYERNQERKFEKKSDEGKDERHLCVCQKDAMLHLDEPGPSSQATVQGREDEAQPAQPGLDGPELKPREGVGDGGQGSDPEDHGKAEAKDSSRHEHINSPVKGDSFALHTDLGIL